MEVGARFCSKADLGNNCNNMYFGEERAKQCRKIKTTFFTILKIGVAAGIVLFS